MLRKEIEAVMKTRSSEDWIVQLNAAGLPCGPIYTIDQMFDDPQVRHLQVTRTVTSPQLGELELVAQPLIVSGVDFQIRAPAPALGEHSREILAELGYKAA